jgi:LPPG:FO 2-phospho-L-lactate transferase
VRRHHADTVLGLEFAGVEEAHVTPEVAAAVQEAAAIVLCPSNPFVSLGPLLAVPGMRDLLRRPGAPIVAVSPIVAGQALRGPAADMLRTLGNQPPSALGVARLYSGLVHGFVLDEADHALAPQVEALGLRALVAPTVMSAPDDRRRLAAVTLAFAQELA